MKRPLFTGCLFLIAAYGAIGAPDPQPQTVSREDFRLAVQELDAAMSKVLKLSPHDITLPKDGQLSRPDMIVQLDALFEHYRPAFRVTPRPYREYPQVIDQYNSDGKIRDILRKLNRWGVIASVGPIVVREEPGMSAHEVGDALGYFYGQIAFLTHQPDPRWTPALANE